MQHGPFLCHYAFHISFLHGIHPDGLYGLHHSLHVYVFHEGRFLNLCNGIFLLVNCQVARTERQRDDIYGKGHKGKAEEDMIQILYVPGAWFEFDVHMLIQLVIVL